MFTYRKVGGLTFLGLGQVTISFCISKKRQAILLPGDLTKIAAMYVGAMVPIVFSLI